MTDRTIRLKRHTDGSLHAVSCDPLPTTKKFFAGCTMDCPAAAEANKWEHIDENWHGWSVEEIRAHTIPADRCDLHGGECGLCSIRDCPWGEPLHYHHDGCPWCCFVEWPETP